MSVFVCSGMMTGLQSNQDVNSTKQTEESSCAIFVGGVRSGFLGW